MPRLTAFVSAILFVDAMLFGAIIPLIPGYAEDFDLSKLDAGLLVGAYGAGALAGGIPGGALAGRLGPKRAVLLGLAVLAVASLGFALAGSPFALGLARFAQGVSSGATWAGALAWLAIDTPGQRRGATLGTAFLFAVVGFILGPAVGAIADAVSIRTTFAACAAVALALGGLAALQPSPRREERVAGAVGRALRDPAFLTGLWLNLLPAFLFGVLDVLVPLELGAAGYGATAIAAVFVAAGLVEAGVNPVVGRISDVRGRLVPVRVALAAALPLTVALAFADEPWLLMTLVIVSAIAFGGFYAPGIALVSDRAELAGLAQGIGFGVMNTSWATGAVAGPTLGGALADSLGDAAPYVLSSALCAATLVVVSARTSRAMQPA